MSTRTRFLLLAAGLGFAVLHLSGCRSVSDESVPEVVESVDLQRYTGTWYEIASFPQRFQRGCHATTAEYSIREDGDIRVVNTCRKDSLQGELSSAEGKAWVVDEATNAKLKVQFFWPFRGDYWIFELGSDYEYAVVGSPDRESLWILSRERQMSAERYRAISEELERNGWDVNLLQRTEQPPADESTVVSD